MKLLFAALNIRLIQNQTYRIVSAYFIALVMAQVFVLQGIDHVFGHHHHNSPCEDGGVHIHSIEDAHFSCDICLFQLSPSEVNECDLAIGQASIGFHQTGDLYSTYQIGKRPIQRHLRGPPSMLV